MIIYDAVTKMLDTEIFPQHNIADLSSGITFIVLFNREKPLRWQEINTHTGLQWLESIDSMMNIGFRRYFSFGSYNKNALKKAK